MTSHLALRLLHILAGTFWVGGGLVSAFFLMPALQASGPAAGPVMQQLTQVRRLPTMMLAMTAVTVLSGLTLYWRISDGFSSGWMRSGAGTTFALGGAVALVAAVLGVVVTSPAAKAAGRLAASVRAAGAAPTPEQGAELARLSRRARVSSQVGAVLLLVATAAMAVARYIP